MLGRSSHAALTQPVRRDDHRRVETGTDVVDPGPQLVAGQPAVAVEHGGGELAGVDRDVPTVVVAGQSGKFGRHSVDERVDVLAENPGHARHRTRTPPPANRWVLS